MARRAAGARLICSGKRARRVAHLVDEDRYRVDEHHAHEARDAEHHDDRAERPRHAQRLEAVDERVERVGEQERQEERDEDAAQQVREPEHEHDREEDHLPAEARPRLLPWPRAAHHLADCISASGHAERSPACGSRRVSAGACPTSALPRFDEDVPAPRPAARGSGRLHAHPPRRRHAAAARPGRLPVGPRAVLRDAAQVRPRGGLRGHRRHRLAATATALREELGDLLLQVVFQAELGRARGRLRHRRRRRGHRREARAPPPARLRRPRRRRTPTRSSATGRRSRRKEKKASAASSAASRAASRRSSRAQRIGEKVAARRLRLGRRERLAREGHARSSASSTSAIASGDDDGDRGRARRRALRPREPLASREGRRRGRAAAHHRQVHAALRPRRGAREERARRLGRPGGENEPPARGARRVLGRGEGAERESRRRDDPARTRLAAHVVRRRPTRARCRSPASPRSGRRRPCVSAAATFHGKQVFRWIHARGVTDASEMTDLPASLRERARRRRGSAGRARRS